MSSLTVQSLLPWQYTNFLQWQYNDPFCHNSMQCLFQMTLHKAFYLDRILVIFALVSHKILLAWQHKRPFVLTAHRTGLLWQHTISHFRDITQYPDSTLGCFTNWVLHIILLIWYMTCIVDILIWYMNIYYDIFGSVKFCNQHEIWDAVFVKSFQSFITFSDH